MDCVLLGDGRDLLRYANLNAALELMIQGPPLIGIGRNRRFREAGRWMLDAGAPALPAAALITPA